MVLHKTKRNGLLALSPMFFMIVLYLLFGFFMGGFSKVPPLVVFLITSVYALFTLRKVTAEKRIDIYSRGAGEEGLLLMVWIFILAGAFVETAKALGAVDCIVNMTLSFLPSSLLLPGLFFASCFISLSIGSAFGTVVALAPIAVGLADSTGMNATLLLGASTGGAFFGDNLSFISDTTVVATRSQECEMKDKFRENITFALPAAIVTAVIYIFLGQGHDTHLVIGDYNFILILPYLCVLVLAIIGVNVMLVLFVGILMTGALGISTGIFDFNAYIDANVKGMESMGTSCFIAMMTGGILSIIKQGGGLTWLMKAITKHIHGRKAAEGSIVVLSAITCTCTSNNTVAIISLGQIAKRISERYNIGGRRTASLLDASTCCVQGLLPYGVQIMFAASAANINPIELIPYEFYPMALFIGTIVTIFLRKRKMVNNKRVNFQAG